MIFILSFAVNVVFHSVTCNCRKLDVFISEVLSLDYEVAKQKSPTYPRLQVVGANEPFAETGYSYAFRKNSPWKPRFDFVINRMKAENK